MSKPLILVILTALCGAGGFALGEVAQMAEATRKTGTREKQESVVFNVGQFVVPMFEGGRVPYFLLAEVSIEVDTYDEVSILSANRPAVRSTVLETFFELERRGAIRPETITPEVVKTAIKEDLENTFEVDRVSAVLLNRLLIQETGKKFVGNEG